MQVKSKVFKRKSGKSEGKWVTRLEYFDHLKGKMAVMERQTERRNDAIDERNRLVNEVKKSQGQIQTGERMTFRALADICAQTIYQPAVIVEGHKIEGVRAHNTAKNHMTVLTDFFGGFLIGEITPESLFEYRRWRLQHGSRHPSMKASGTMMPVKLATVNRELSAMRRMMRLAYAKGWVTKDIFFKVGVIEEAAEVERTRLLSQSEEELLLAACQGTRIVSYERTRHGKKEIIRAEHSVDNPRLKAMILLAMDAGMRRGEILKLEWRDIDFHAGLIQIRGTNTKTERERLVPLTERAKEELHNIQAITTGTRPFPFADFKRSWATAKRIAGIENLRFHDLRRTAITRWIQMGNPIALAGKIAGHTRLETTMKHYTAADVEIVGELKERINARNQSLVQGTIEGIH
ncbi:MAG TPA: site-specific integrase [Pyrinomonadaceae bacterium]|jgi:integrase|nr:site-specific integrase [Pyrinomonadaceae bacterium]